MGRLFLVATPIGNLEDMTMRGVECLRSVDLIACEDTRHSRVLLDHYDIKAKLTSYHEHNKYEKADELIDMIRSGKDIALITDAGTPGISDPGEVLVQKAYDAGVEVTALPGASAVITALSICGLSSRRFVFEGFLPADKKERRHALERLREENRTMVIYEAPHRILKTLDELLNVLGDRRIRICRELTKKFEEVMAFSVAEAAAHFKEHEPRGEMVVVIEGMSEADSKRKKALKWQDMSAREHVDMYMARGLDEKEAMKEAARDRGVNRREIYAELKVNGDIQR